MHFHFFLAVGLHLTLKARCKIVDAFENFSCALVYIITHIKWN